MEEVAWWFREVGCDLLHELLLLLEFEAVVIGVLGTHCAEIASSDGFATGWPWPVTRVQSHTAIKFLHLLDGIVEHAGQISTGDFLAAGEVRSAHLSQKDSISRKKSYIFVGWVDELEAWTFEGVSRGVDEFDFDVSQSEQLAISALLDLESIDLPDSSGSHDNGHLELSMPREIIRMVMRQHDIFEHRMPILDIFLVGVNIKDGINKDTLLLRLDVVGEDGQFWGFELGEEEALAWLLGWDG